jgi:hypothetical protein
VILITQFAIFHAGDQNSWADLLSRWGGNNFQCDPPSQLAMLTLPNFPVTQISTLTKPVDPTYRVQPFKNIVWPDASEIIEVQKIYFPKSNFARNSDGLLVESRNRVVIPTQCEDLIIRLCVIAHAGCNSGHIGYHAALNLLRDRVYWIGMETDVKNICSSCFH